MAVERHHLLVIGEQQVEVLQRLPQPKALHLVDSGRVDILHILQARIPPSGNPGIPFERLEDLPPPFSCLLLTGDLVHVEEALHCLRPKDVVRVG
eukprot:51222-Eustigmatos_ZCMA.PRE.1